MLRKPHFPTQIFSTSLSVRCFASVLQTPSLGNDSGGDSSSSTASAAKSPIWKRVLGAAVKGVLLWFPATLFWLQLVVGVPTFDFRTDEEVLNEEQELQRLERFFDVHLLPEDESIIEWQAKEEALNQVVEKLLKSQRFMDMLEKGFEDATGAPDGSQASWSSSKKVSAKELDARSQTIAVSYILKPAPAEADEDTDADAPLEHSSSALAPWTPRVMVQHRSGALALVILGLEHVEKAKDREERWTCTHLRVELIAGPDGDSYGEPLCDLSGHSPHGVRYLRI